jgi:hypothetical protein
VEERKWEREGGSGGQQRGAKDVAGNGPRPSGTGGGAVARIGESGGARVTRCGAGVANRRGVDRWAQATQCRGAVQTRF